MRAGFFHDFPAYRGENNEYYSIGFPYSLWKRYLENFDELIIGSRVRELSNQKFDKNKLQKSSGQAVSIRPISAYNSHLSFLTNRRKITQQIKEIIDVTDVVIIRLPSVIGNLAYKQAVKQNKKIIVELVACPWDALWNYGTLKTKIMAPIMYSMTKTYVEKADNVIYVTNEFLQKRYPNHKHNIGCSDVVIPNVETNILEKRNENILSSKQTVRLGLIGNATNRFKGHDTALKALSLLAGETPPIELHLLGHGDTNRLDEEIQKNNLTNLVVFDGVRKSGKEVWDWLDEIDIYIQPSLQEGLNRATLEAMSRGCPVITTNVGGFPEITRNDFIIETNDSTELALRIKALIKNPQLYQEISEYNYNKAKEYSGDKLDGIRNKFFQEVITR